MMVIMVPMEIPANRYYNYFHMITDVEKFASCPQTLYNPFFYLSYLRAHVSPGNPKYLGIFERKIVSDV